MRIREVDGLRALAVLAVLAYHAVAVAPDLQGLAWTLCGSHGVDLFFIVSGFCLSYPILLKRRDGGSPVIDYGTYLARRVIRIVPPYLIALSLFAALAFTPFGLPTAVASLHLSAAGVLHAYLLDALFLTGPIPALNGSFWTMGIEMSWYLVFPAIMLLFLRSPWAVAVFMAICYALALAPSFAEPTLRALPAFAAGLFAAELRIGGVRYNRYALLVAIGIAALVLVTSSGDRLMDRGNPFWQALGLCVVLASASGPFARALRWPPLRAIGIASFSIYLVHQPIEAYVEAHGFSPWIGGSAGLLLGFAFYGFVERPLTAPAFRRFAEAFVLGIRRHDVRRPMDVPFPGG